MHYCVILLCYCGPGPIVVFFVTYLGTCYWLGGPIVVIICNIPWDLLLTVYGPRPTKFQSLLCFSTVKPLLSGHPLSGHPLLGSQLPKCRKYRQYNTVNKTFIKQPPLLSGRGHLLAVPMRIRLLFLPLFSSQQEYKVQSLAFFSTSSLQITV